MKKSYRFLFFILVLSGCEDSLGPSSRIVEYSVSYPPGTQISDSSPSSTHEITFNPLGNGDLWVTGQNYDNVVQIALDGTMKFHQMSLASGPHGIVFDKHGNLWVGFEFSAQIVKLDSQGKIIQTLDTHIDCSNCTSGSDKINPGVHGLTIDPDGTTLWYTGKSVGIIGKIGLDGKSKIFQLKTEASAPIYIKAGADGSMWFTEYLGNAVGKISPDGILSEFPLPNIDSRPIAIIQGPNPQEMWFSEQRGRVAKIDVKGKITEYTVTSRQENMLLAGLAFDTVGNLWIQQYVDNDHPLPAGPDYLIKMDAITHEFTFYEVPSRNTVMHRIILGPDGNLWFTEMMANKVSKMQIAP